MKLNVCLKVLFSWRGFYLNAWFLDNEGRIMSEKRIFTAGHMESIQTWAFRREVELPKGTSGISFTYSGEAVDPAIGSDSTSFSFWMRPLR